MELLDDRKFPDRVDFLDDRGREYSVPSSGVLEQARNDGVQFSYMMYVRIPRGVTRAAYEDVSKEFVELPEHGENIRIYASSGRRGHTRRGEFIERLRVLDVISNYSVSKNTGIVLF